MLECGGKGGPMNRLFSLLLISLFTLVICPRTSSMPTSDEETLKNLEIDRKSTRLNSSHVSISYAVFCLKKKSHRMGAGDPLPARDAGGSVLLAQHLRGAGLRCLLRDTRLLVGPQHRDDVHAPYAVLHR